MTNEVSQIVENTEVVKEQVTESVQTHLAESKAFADQVLDWLSQNGADYLMHIAFAALMLVVGWLVIKIVSATLRKALLRKGMARTLLANFVCSVVSKSLWAILLVMVLGRLGVNVAPLIAGLGVTGFILGFAFQESLGNLASGLMIALNEPFKVGDYVLAAGLEGAVLEVNMMATVLSTADNKRVVVPNKSVWGGPITNFSALRTRRVDMQVGIAYGSDVAKALSVIRETIAKVPGVLAEPAAGVSINSLDEACVTINVRPWSTTADYWNVYAAAYEAVQANLAQAGFRSPRRTVEMLGAK